MLSAIKVSYIGIYSGLSYNIKSITFHCIYYWKVNTNFIFLTQTMRSNQPIFPGNV